MRADSPPAPAPVQSVQKDARRTDRISCCILECLGLDGGKATQLTWFCQCDRILTGGLILIYHHTPTGKKEWPLPLWASPLIKLPTDTRGPVNGLPVCRSQTQCKHYCHGVNRQMLPDSLTSNCDTARNAVNQYLQLIAPQVTWCGPRRERNENDPNLLISYLFLCI